MKNIYTDQKDRLCALPSCNNIITGRASQKYCCAACKSADRSTNKKHVACIICSKVFHKISNSLTCSKECSSVLYEKQKELRNENIGKLYLKMCYDFQKCVSNTQQKQYIEKLLNKSLSDNKVRQALTATAIHDKLKLNDKRFEGLEQQKQELRQKDVGNRLICILTLFKNKTFDISFISWSEYKESFLQTYQAVETKTVVGLVYEEDAALVSKLELLANSKDKRLELLIEMGILSVDLKQAERILAKSKLNINLILVMKNYIYSKTGASDINQYIKQRKH